MKILFKPFQVVCQCTVQVFNVKLQIFHCLKHFDAVTKETGVVCIAWIGTFVDFFFSRSSPQNVLLEVVHECDTRVRCADIEVVLQACYRVTDHSSTNL